MEKVNICLCLGSSCFARGNEKNMALLEAFMTANNLHDGVELDLNCSLCQAVCADGPNVVINGKTYGKVDTSVMGDLLKKYFPTAKTSSRFMLKK